MPRTSRQTATSTTQVDDATVCITHWHFEPGQATGWNRHTYAYAVVPIVDGTLRIISDDGEKIVPLKAGVSYARPAGVEHDVVNAGAQNMIFIEIEMKKC